MRTAQGLRVRRTYLLVFILLSLGLALIVGMALSYASNLSRFQISVYPGLHREMVRDRVGEPSTIVTSGSRRSVLQQLLRDLQEPPRALVEPSGDVWVYYRPPYALLVYWNPDDQVDFVVTVWL